MRLALDHRAAGTHEEIQIAVSIGLHRSLGFAAVGHFHEVGFKFGRWLDLLFMQRILDPAVADSRHS